MQSSKDRSLQCKHTQGSEPSVGPCASKPFQTEYQIFNRRAARSRARFRWKAMVSPRLRHQYRISEGDREWLNRSDRKDIQSKRNGSDIEAFTCALKSFFCEFESFSVVNGMGRGRQRKRIPVYWISPQTPTRYTPIPEKTGLSPEAAVHFIWVINTASCLPGYASAAC